MYNRYIPQPDGSFRKNRMQEPVQQKPFPKPPAQSPPQHQQEIPKPPPCPAPTAQPPQHYDMPSFLRQLLPKNFDTGDLFVILLLLLMAGDNPENRNQAILTIALYFLM